jgi:hypothetical protein
MRKIYTKKFIFTLCFLMMLFSLGFGQKTILYVGADAWPTTRTSDSDMVDSLKAWGFNVTYIDDDSYQLAENVYNGIDGVFFGESVGSASVTRFGPNPLKSGSTFQDNFPLNFITLEIGALSSDATASKWALFTATGGIKVAATTSAPADFTMKIVDNEHYITKIFTLNQEVVWSSTTSVSDAVGYVHGIKYEIDGLAVPTVTNFDGGAPPTQAYTMLVIEDFSLPWKGFVFGMTHAYIENQLGTSDFFRIMHRAASYIYDSYPAAIEDKLARKVNDYDLIAFPNPATVQATIRFNAAQPENATITLIDMTGKQIATVYNQRTVTGNNIVFLNADDYVPGIYFVKLQIGNNTAYTKILFQ